jgi:hypothetical protein
LFGVPSEKIPFFEADPKDPNMIEEMGFQTGQNRSKAVKTVNIFL